MGAVETLWFSEKKNVREHFFPILHGSMHKKNVDGRLPFSGFKLDRRREGCSMGKSYRFFRL